MRPNLVPGVPLWIANPNVAGGKEINPAAFTIPTGAVQGDLGRNALRGFGATQVDLTLRRQFKLRERLSLQARADLFNIFNHPNFGPPINYLSSPLFGQSTQMLGASLGSGGQNGGLNPLYQIGGPRSAATGAEAPVLSGIAPGENGNPGTAEPRTRRSLDVADGLVLEGARIEGPNFVSIAAGTISNHVSAFPAACLKDPS